MLYSKSWCVYCLVCQSARFFARNDLQTQVTHQLFRIFVAWNYLAVYFSVRSMFAGWHRGSWCAHAASGCMYTGILICVSMHIWKQSSQTIRCHSLSDRFVANTHTHKICVHAYNMSRLRRNGQNYAIIAFHFDRFVLWYVLMNCGAFAESAKMWQSLFLKRIKTTSKRVVTPSLRGVLWYLCKTIVIIGAFRLIIPHSYVTLAC